MDGEATRRAFPADDVDSTCSRRSAQRRLVNQRGAQNALASKGYRSGRAWRTTTDRIELMASDGQRRTVDAVGSQTGSVLLLALNMP